MGRDIYHHVRETVGRIQNKKPWKLNSTSKEDMMTAPVIIGMDFVSNQLDNYLWYDIIDMQKL